MNIPTLPTGLAHPHPEPLSGARYSAMELLPSHAVVMLDQRKLPRIEKYEVMTTVAEVAAAIADMVVRGAPAIGIAAAYGMVCAAMASKAPASAFVASMTEAATLLNATRPTAVNLSWATGRMLAHSAAVAALEPMPRAFALADFARDIHRQDVASCRAMGVIGAEYIQDGSTVLTHCNAGALATGGFGTALGVIRAAVAQGKRIRVLAAETRPFLQGARLTAWELAKDQIPVTVITDSMVGHYMQRKEIQAVVVGADRVVRSGHVANKIGTYGVACLANAHGIPFYVAAPLSTVDLATATGADIVIEQRSEREVTHIEHGGASVALVPEGVPARHPAFDVTPPELVTAFFTERGAAVPLNETTLAKLVGDAS